MLTVAVGFHAPMKTPAGLCSVEKHLLLPSSAFCLLPSALHSMLGNAWVQRKQGQCNYEKLVAAVENLY